jgi:hypothetical protein
VEVHALEQAHLFERLLDERGGRVLLGQLEKVLRQRARVRADPHRGALRLCGAHHLGHLVRAADVARVDADGGHAGLDRPERERRVEMDVGDERDGREVDELRERVGVLALRHGDAHELAAGRDELADLRHRRVDVVRLRERHGLHDDGRAAADRHASDPDLTLARHPGEV